RPLPALALAEPDPARRRLAFFVAVARRYDAQVAFSASSAWRAVRGWPDAGETLFTWGEEALDETPARYPTARGRTSPADDLVASIARANTDPGFACAFPLRARALYDAGLTREPPAIERAGGCPDFDAWAAPERVEAIELVYASPSWASPASSVGHVFLRLRAPSDGPFVGESAERTLGHGVDMTAPGNGEDGFVLRGLTGGYRATLLESTSYARWLEYGAAEQRDLYVYELVLDPRERRYLLAELWREHDAGLSVRYYFLSVNCARMTWDALRAALPALRREAAWYFHPHELVSQLLALGRARPLGAVLSQRTRARRGEEARDTISEKLSKTPGFAALHEARHGTPVERVAALQAFAAQLDPATLDAAAATDLARYLDATLDVETFATDEATGAVDPRRTGPAVDAALALRASLPIGASARLDPFPPVEVRPSASRRWTTRLGWDVTRQAAGLALRYAVIDEQPGTQRAARLRPAGRTVLLASELHLRWRGEDTPSVDHSRLTLLRVDGFGQGVRTTDGALGARLGLGFGVTLESTPSARSPTSGVVASIGPNLTVAADEPFSRYLVVGLEVRGSAWLEAATPLRASVDARLEAGLPIAGRHRLRLTARLSPYVTLDDYGLAGEVSGALELVLDRELGLVLSPVGTWRVGEVVGDTAELGLALTF
ncbi:MAG: DUF4105 domain-containing protein, partial [Deltaproteobacteria bacterium]